MEGKKEYTLKGLTCPHCASQIEHEVNGLPGVKEASLNLMTTRLSVVVDEKNEKDIYTLIHKVVKSHEPSVDVISMENGIASLDDEEEGIDNIKLYLLRLLIAGAIALVFSFIKVPNVVTLIAFLVAYFIAGYDILLTAGKNILKGKVFDENFLMGIASVGAFFIGEWVEAVTVLIFYGAGELLQDMAVQRSKKNITNLMDIRPDYANVKDGNSLKVVAPELVQVGDIIVIKPGEKVPLDGVITLGRSFIDTRAITGESVPVEVAAEDEVYSGTINTSGTIEVRVTKPFAEATVSKIMELVQNASSKKAESEKFITKFARYYTPAVVFTALAVAILPPMLGFGAYTTWLYRALSFLIISCPCALVISIPLSFFGGIGGAAKQGVLIKGGNYLEALKHVDTIVFDKTGTLTKGVFKVTKIAPARDENKEELIYLAAVAESQSNHPIAKSIIRNYGKEITEAVQITEKAGFGVIALRNTDEILAGNKKLMEEAGITITEPDTAGSIVHVALNKRYLGYILVSDEIKSGTKNMLRELKQMGIRRTVMLTGDHNNKAKEVAKEIEIDEYYAGLLPQDKVERFTKMKGETSPKGKVVFVGDGINDAPVLAGADIGIAMGGIGSDAAIEAADVVIMNDDIEKVVTAIKIARKTGSIVTQNIIFALGVKLIIMLLSFLGISSIWFAIFADVGVALIALVNAMRAMYFK
ncbi:MAG: cadA: cadmium, zinc and cobalt-transporting ATPase [Herbinix sp.]|nr:cadA: cadmium, zinc and cobalt-transporting ATPase [Herbinix sp.]